MPVAPPPNAKRVFKGHVLNFWQWEQPLYNGTLSTFECITRPDTASIIPFLDSQTVLLTRQEQPHKDKPFLDFPGGRIDEGEETQTGVLRELQEETGHRAGRVMRWDAFAQRGMIRYEETLFIATDLTNEHLLHQDPGERIELVPTPWNDLVQLCLERRLRQPNSMLTVLQMEFDPASKKRLQEWLRG
jgi:ADP-ribose pyrophosphatase